MTNNIFEDANSNGSEWPLGRPISRRKVLAGLAGAGVISLVGSPAGALQGFAVRGVTDNPVLVNVFLRGGADGIGIVVPYGDDDYYAHRSTIAQQRSTLADLDGFFGLHSAFAPLNPIYDSGELAFVHAAGSQNKTRSHFEAMDNMDYANGSGGWMQRALAVERAGDPLHGMTIGDRAAPSMRGPFGGLALQSVASMVDDNKSLQAIRGSLSTMYESSGDPLSMPATLDAFAAVDTLSAINRKTSVKFPRSKVGKALNEAAVLIKANIGVKMLAINVGGWDHHKDENQRMSRSGESLSEALAAFHQELAGERGRVLTVATSEFGRTARQNGSGGTDHGYGGIMAVMGGDLARRGGGKVHLADGKWPGLGPDDLSADRDLDITTDYRSVLAELLDRHMGIDIGNQVFPGFQPRYLNLL